jgi:hypothetical protein
LERLILKALKMEMAKYFCLRYLSDTVKYFHYLTKWMFALNRMSIAKKDTRYNDWAIELAQAVHSRFVFGAESDRPRMVLQSLLLFCS